MDHAEGLETSAHAVLHDLSREAAAAQRVVGGREVLLRPEAISAEHERPVHIEQDNREASEHVGGIALVRPPLLPGGSTHTYGISQAASQGRAAPAIRQLERPVVA